MGNTDYKENPLLTARQKRVLGCYLAFVVAYCLSIVAAVLISGAGGLVPVDGLWFSVMGNLLVQSSNLATRVFLSTAPLLVTLNLNLIWCRMLFVSSRFIIRGVSIRVVLGTILALPLLIVAVSMMIISAELTWGWFELLPAYLAIFFATPLVYMLAITTISASEKKQILSRTLSDLRLWVGYLLVLLALLFPVIAIVHPFFRGYWTVIPLGGFDSLLSRAIPISLVLPALPYTFALCGSRTDHQV